MKKSKTMLSKTLPIMALSTVALGATFGGCSFMEEEFKPPIVPETPPNIVFLMMDDTGARDLGCFGNDFCETPNIDRLCDRSVKFTDYYTQPLCSPSRSALLTGQNVVRTGITDYIPGQSSHHIDCNEFTLLPQLLHDNGYHTGILGKWHLSSGYDENAQGLPKDAGFDEIIMSEQKFIGPGDYFYPYFHLPQVTDQEEGKYLIDNMNEEAVKFIDRNQKSPFFLYFSHFATHINLDAPQEDVEYFQQKRGERADKNEQDRNPYLAAMLKHVDDGVGMIVDKLEELNMLDNTIFVVTSDNGGDEHFTANGELRAGKGTIYEGGIRDPLIISWPKKTGKKVITTPVSEIDFYETLAQSANIPADKIPENSGVSLLPLIEGTGEIERDNLYWCFPRFGSLGGIALRENNFKCVEKLDTGVRELYNLAEDPGETTNIIGENTQIASDLLRKLHENLRKDSVGKVFNATFAGNEYYWWESSGAIVKAQDKMISTDSSRNITTLQGFVRYDTDITYDVKLSQGSRGGLVMRANFVTPSSPLFGGYSVILNEKEDKVQLLSVTATGERELYSVDFNIEANKVYKVKVSAYGENIRVFVDNKQVMDCYDSRYMMGTVGFMADGNIVEFDNLSVTGVKCEAPLTNAQLKFEKESNFDDYIDDEAVYFENQPVVKEGKQYVEINEILRHLKVESTSLQGVVTAKANGIELKIDFNGKTAEVNKNKIEMPPCFEQNGNNYILLDFLCNTFNIGIKYVNENKVLIETMPTYFIFDTEKYAIDYVGNWVTMPSNLNAFGGNTTRSNVKGESATLAFYGIGARIYMARGPMAGVMNVYVDGNFKEEIDTYSSYPFTRGLVYEISGLDAGMHEIKIETAGKKIAGKGVNVNLDAFEVITRNEGRGIKSLKSPSISLKGDILTINPVENAIGYTLIANNFEYDCPSTQFNLKEFFAGIKSTDFNGKIKVFAKGDGKNYNNSIESNPVNYSYIVGLGGTDDISYSGKYQYENNNLKQVKNTPDNRYPNYDKIVFTNPVKEFTLSATLKSEYIATTINSKFGIMLALSDDFYYDIFFLPENNTVSLLSTTNGGGTFDRFWEMVECNIDLEQGVDVKVTKRGDLITIYANNQVIFTDETFVTGDNPFYVGFVSEAVNNVSYNNIVLNATQSVNKPQITIKDGVLTFIEDANAIKYMMEINGDKNLVEINGDFNLYDYMAYNKFENGMYSIRVMGKGKDGFNDSEMSDVVRYDYTYINPTLTKLATPVVKLNGDNLVIDKVENATSYLVTVSNFEKLEFEVKEGNFNIKEALSQKGYRSGSFDVSVVAKGDGVKFNNSDESNKVNFLMAVAMTSVKGTYKIDKASVTLTKTGGTINADNYRSGYDKILSDESFGDVIISAVVNVDATNFNKFTKIGVCVEQAGDTYFQAFLRNNKSLAMLQLNQGKFVYPKVWKIGRIFKNADFSKGVEMRIERRGNEVKVYMNTLLASTEQIQGGNIKVGFVSESYENIKFNNVTIKTL